MFKQIVSQLSMTPQAASQLTFYARRLKQESVTRFFSAFAAALLVLLQVVTVVSPATASNAASDNDLVPGGYTTKADFLSIYDKSPNLKLIYTRFGITRADIASPNTKMTKINSRQDGNTLKSVGHHPTTCANETKYVVGSGAQGTVYLRPLSCFDTGANKVNGSSYDALVGKRASDGGYFAILKVCGNIVVKTVPPQSSYSCTSLKGSPLTGPAPLKVGFTATAQVGGGEKIAGYRYNFGDGVVQDAPTALTTSSSGHTYTKAGTYFATVSVNNVSTHQLKSSPACAVTIKVTAAPTPTPTPSKSATPTPSKTPSPTPTPLKTPTPTPGLACTSLTGSSNSGTVPLKVVFETVGSAQNQTITDYNFDFGDGITATSKTNSVTHTYLTAGSYTATSSVKGSNGGTATSEACKYQITAGSVPPAFTQLKTALNQTQNVDATKQPANGGDVIAYSLTTKNTGGSKGDIETSDNIADILEYGDVTNLGGGTITEKIISWPTESLDAGKTVTHTFIVTVKNPVPVTATGVSNPRSFDLKMDNVFGNPVSVDIVAPPSKQIEVASATMPETGPGTSIMIIVIVGAMIFFFYLRNRQLVAEIRILRNEYQGDASHVG